MAEIGHKRPPLPAGLTMRYPAAIDDVHRVAKFNAEIFGPECEAMTVRLLTQHPRVTWKDLVFVEDGDGVIISSLLYVPMKWRYGCASIEVAEMSLVGTLPSYRRMGLARAQVGYYAERMRSHQAKLSAIQGIPHFYRQFGYDYALPLEGGWRWNSDDFNQLQGKAYPLRPARAEDIPYLISLWQEGQHNLTICVERDADLWRYLLENSDPNDAMGHETLVVDNQSGVPIAYVRLPFYHFGQALTVSEASNMPLEIGLGVLRWLRTRALESSRTGIRLMLPDQNDLTQLAKSYGAYAMRRYAWQILIPSRGDFLRAIVAELDRRISASTFAQMSRSIVISFYEDAYRLDIKDGQIADISSLDSSHSQLDIVMPSQAFLPLAMGTRSVDEVRSFYPDLSGQGEAIYLLETLFPKHESYIYAGY